MRLREQLRRRQLPPALPLLPHGLSFCGPPSTPGYFSFWENTPSPSSSSCCPSLSSSVSPFSSFSLLSSCLSSFSTSFLHPHLLRPLVPPHLHLLAILLHFLLALRSQ